MLTFVWTLGTAPKPQETDAPARRRSDDYASGNR